MLQVTSILVLSTYPLTCMDLAFQINNIYTMQNAWFMLLQVIEVHIKLSQWMIYSFRPCREQCGRGVLNGTT